MALDEVDLRAIGDRSLVWVDVDLDAGGSLDLVAEPLRLDARDRRRIEVETGRSRMLTGIDRLHVTLEALEPDGDRRTLVRREIDLLAAPGVVVTVHRGRIAALDRFAENVTGETSLGLLDAGDLLSSVIDEVITGYFKLAEDIELEIDRLDHAALRGDPAFDVLAAIVDLRRRVSFIRRSLTPHRTALAALARPEMDVESGVGRPWPGLTNRLESAIGAIEALRDALLGTYDIHMGRVAQRANDVMKALTLLSAVLLPAVVLAGVMGMNFKVPFFDEPRNFYLVVAMMVGFAGLLLGLARWRRWL